MAWPSETLRPTKFGALLVARIATNYTKQITDPHVGDAYTFVGIERNTKLILAWHLGERGMQDTEAFTEKLHEATNGHFQLTTDGYRPYENAVSYSLGTRVDYAHADQSLCSH